MLTVAEKYGGIDDFLVETMIRLGIPIEESYLQYRLSGLMCLQEGTGLRKGRLHIPDSYMLMGTADPTGILERDEVCVILYVYFSLVLDSYFNFCCVFATPVR